MVTLKAYTDGACSGNPGPGGWGVYWTEGNAKGVITSEELYGSNVETTNNKMELTAAVEALKILKQRNGSEITIFTDSKYVMDGINQWIDRWRSNGWKKADGKPVANQELWKQLHELTSRCMVNWEWVKGHAGHEGNERADALAVRGRDEAKSQLSEREHDG